MENHIFSIDGVSSSNAPAMVGAVFFTFTFVFFGVLAFLDMGKRRNDIKRRITLDRNMYGNGLPNEDWIEQTSSLRYQNVSETSALLGDVERGATTKETEASKIKRDMIKAGFFGPNSVVWYQSIRLILSAGLCLVAIVATQIYFTNLAPGTQMMIIIAAAALGFLLPNRYIARRQGQIVLQCQEGFPDFIDLMVVCAEGGLSPRTSIDRISAELAQTYPFFGANLYLANLEIQAGNSLHDALYSLGNRTKVEEASILASLLQQTEQLGTSISDALRIYSDEMRDKRLMRAEEKAHALPVKLVMPLGLFIFPVILIVILLPVVIRMQTALM